MSLGLGQDQRIFLCTAKKRASNRVCHSRKVLTSFLTRYQKALSRVKGKKRIDLMEEFNDSKGGEETRVDELRVVFLSTEVSPWYVMSCHVVMEQCVGRMRVYVIHV